MVATEELLPMLSVEGYRRVMSGVPGEVRRIEDGEEIAIGAVRWVAHQLRGHTDGQLLFHAPEHALLIAGDQVLPRITSNIGIYPERADPEPLGSFLASFQRLAALEPEPLVLPSHGNVFRGLRLRLAQLEAHHERTLAALAALVTRPATAAELAPGLFRAPLDPLNLMLAVGETLAHLEHLVAGGRLSVSDAGGGPRRYGPAAGV
jgi:glyoxylase-like metal-dependent hydrolase (beta-lactamase superfamily II)